MIMSDDIVVYFYSLSYVKALVHSLLPKSRQTWYTCTKLSESEELYVLPQIDSYTLHSCRQFLGISTELGNNIDTHIFDLIFTRKSCHGKGSNHCRQWFSTIPKVDISLLHATKGERRGQIFYNNFNFQQQFIISLKYKIKWKHHIKRDRPPFLYICINAYKSMNIHVLSWAYARQSLPVTKWRKILLAHCHLLT